MNNRAVLGRKSTYFDKFLSYDDFEEMTDRLTLEHQVWAKKNQDHIPDPSSPYRVDPFPRSDYSDALDVIFDPSGRALADTIEIK